MPATSEQPTWYAAVAVTAPLVAHLLWPHDRLQKTRRARCGELRRGWQPVADFAAPAAFTRCVECAATTADDE